MGITILILGALSSAYGMIDYLSIPTNDIETPHGKITGAFSLYGNHRKFLGIPYATVAGRFQAPGDPPNWNDTLDANANSPSCPQYIEILPTPLVGQEDCLTLNIYTPLVTQDEPLPVMVFFHGGDFVVGSNYPYLFDPIYLVEKKIIVVSVNYRLGALGFLCLKNEGAPGNAGLKDQLAALKWVKNNIEYFGGDQNSITLFGQGAGAASINYLMASPQSDGLFDRAILQSGSMVSPLAFDYNPIQTASSIAAKLGLNSTDPDKLLEFFSNVTVNDLAKATSDELKNGLESQMFRPCIEESGEGAIVTAYPYDLLQQTQLKPGVQVIIGYNNKESLIYASKYNYSAYQNILEDPTPIIPDNINLSNDDDKAAFIQEVKKMYFDNEDGTDFYNKLSSYFSDIFFMYPSVAVADALLKNSNVSMYNYYFTYDSIRNIFKILNGVMGEKGAVHGDELLYLFELGPLQLTSPVKEDAKIIYKMTTMWAYFALTGNPSIPASLPWTTEWKESTQHQLNFLEINSDVKMIPLPNQRRIDFWKNAYEKYGTKK